MITLSILAIIGFSIATGMIVVLFAIERPTLGLLNSFNGLIPDSEEIHHQLMQTKDNLGILNKYKIPYIKSAFPT